MTPRGIASPQYKHGRYAQDIPARLAGKYQEALDDTRLTELRDELSLVRSRAQDLLSRVDSGESGHLWKQLQKAYRALTTAKDGQEQLAAIAEIGQLIRRGAADYEAWEEVSKQIDRMQRLAESERKRLVEQQQTMTYERAMAWIGAIEGILLKHVTDRTILAAIAHDLRLLTLRGDGRALGA